MNESSGLHAVVWKLLDVHDRLTKELETTTEIAIMRSQHFSDEVVPMMFL